MATATNATTATTVDLKATLRQLSEWIDKPKAERKNSALLLCLAEIGCVLEDDSAEVPADAFAEMSPDARKVALAGMVFMIHKVMTEESA